MLAGATVTGIVGLFFDKGTVENAGTISGNFSISANDAIVTNSGLIASVTNTGIAALNNATVSSNTGTIQGNSSAIDATTVNVNNDGGLIKAGGAAIHANGDATVTNNVIGSSVGTIIGVLFGIDATNANVTNHADIVATGAGGTAIHATGTATVSNTNSSTVLSTVTADSFGINAGTVIVNANNGRIEATGTNGVAINAATDVTVTSNTGTIQANGTGGKAIHATGTATVSSNTGNGTTTGIITGGDFGIDAGTVIVTANTGKIEAIATDGINGFAINAANTATVNNSSSGVITADKRAINAGTVIVGNAGLVEATRATGAAAIVAQQNANVTNSGLIRANGANGGNVAISVGNNADVTNSGRIESTGIDGFGIGALGTATVNNSGGIQADRIGINGVVGVDLINSGTIQATGANGVAISSSGTATVNNTGNGTTTGLITGGAFGIQAGTLAVTNVGGTISGGTSGIVGSGSVTNAGTITGGVFGIQATTLAVTNAFGGTISGGASAIVGSGIVTNAGTITGGTNAVSFQPGATTNTLILQTGSVLNGAANGNLGATNNLILQGNGTVSNAFSNFNSLDVQAVGSWTWNTTTNFDTTTVTSGTFVLDSTLNSSALTVKSGGTLAGQGRIGGDVTVASGGTVAPGAAVPFSTLTVIGNVGFTTGSFFNVNVNPAVQNDKLVASGATLSGGTVNVLAQNGTYSPSTKYTILTTTNSNGLSGTFDKVTSNLAFLKPTLSYDATDVFLTLDLLNNGGGGGLGFSSVAQTRNQIAVATALDASPVTDPLVKALFNQTADGARQAFDALSGEVFGSVQNTQAGQTQFARSAMLGRMRQASYSGAPGELGALAFGGPELAYASGDANGFPVKAPGMGERSRDLTFWAQGLGGWGHTDSDGNAASVSSRFGGFLSGVDARYGDTLRAGLVAGYLRSDLNAAARSSSAGIDSAQLGAYAGGRLGALNVRGGASYSYDGIDTSRAIAFPGFTDQTQAHFHGHVGQVFGEVGYGMTFGSVAVEPLAGLAYVHLHNGAFLESGGVAALSGSSVNENIGYSSLGVRAATALPLANGTVLVPRGSLQWQHAFGDVTPAAALAFQGTGAAFSVAGVPIARDTALIESGFDWRFSPQARLGAYYQGELAAHAQAHAFKGTFNWNF
ncbi:MAG: autotransporter domain-containing protein [Pseudolabrys sp.]